MVVMKNVVMRMGHRLERDKRTTTHIGLVARAFGADGMIISDVNDSKIQAKILDVKERFGGDFFVEMGIPWRKVLKKWKDSGGEIVHLTAYGLPLPSVIDEVRNSPKDKLIVVGAEKVPKLVYELATHNISVTNQPHSEIAALAVFLDHLFQGAEFNKKFENAQVEIIPSETDKNLRKLTED